jgi:hypothetical protein
VYLPFWSPFSLLFPQEDFHGCSVCFSLLIAATSHVYGLPFAFFCVSFFFLAPFSFPGFRAMLLFFRPRIQLFYCALPLSPCSGLRGGKHIFFPVAFVFPRLTSCRFFCWFPLLERLLFLVLVLPFFFRSLYAPLRLSRVCHSTFSPLNFSSLSYRDFAVRCALS